MKWIFFVFFGLGNLLLVAQQNTIHLSPKVQISSKTNLAQLMELHHNKNEATDYATGYRIQIASNNDRSKIYNLRSQVYQQFPQIKNYLKYDQPYYKLRIGDFETRLNARHYLEQVIQHFPSAFIVIDEIKVR